MQRFYQGFPSAARGRGIIESDQPKALERAQKALWVFGRYGSLDEDGSHLQLGLQDLQERLKIPRPEETFALLGDLGAPVEFREAGKWAGARKLKGCDAVRMSFSDQAARGDLPLTRALPDLIARILTGTPKEKAAYERFLRANPQAVLAREKPGPDLPPDAPAILANLLTAAEAWRELVRFLSGFSAYRPAVEFRSIHHGMWVVNYESQRSGRDLCGLIVQNGEMTVRTILYEAMHLRVKGMLDQIGNLVRAAFLNAHYYEEFKHQWLFIPCSKIEDTLEIKQLLAMQAKALSPAATD